MMLTTDGLYLSYLTCRQLFLSSDGRAQPLACHAGSPDSSDWLTLYNWLLLQALTHGICTNTAQESLYVPLSNPHLRRHGLDESIFQ